MILEYLLVGALVVAGGALVRKVSRFRHATNDRGELIAGDDRLVPGDKVSLRGELAKARDARYTVAAPPGVGTHRDPARLPGARRWEGEIVEFRIAPVEIAHDNAYPAVLLEMDNGRTYPLNVLGAAYELTLYKVRWPHGETEECEADLVRAS